LLLSDFVVKIQTVDVAGGSLLSPVYSIEKRAKKVQKLLTDIAIRQLSAGTYLTPKLRLSASE
jgi:hypothetical protein